MATSAKRSRGMKVKARRQLRRAEAPERWSWTRVAARITYRNRTSGSGAPPYLTRMLTSHTGRVSDDTLAIITRLAREGVLC